MTQLILERFRLNGCLLMAGHALVADVGLTSARWQVLGAVALSPVPLPVALIARNMGLTGQAVQRLANDMERDGLVRYAPNPHHQRAKLVLLTPRAKSAYDAAMKRQRMSMDPFLLLRFAHLVGPMLMAAGLIGVFVADMRSRQVRDVRLFAQAVTFMLWLTVTAAPSTTVRPTKCMSPQTFPLSSFGL